MADTTIAPTPTITPTPEATPVATPVTSQPAPERQQAKPELEVKQAAETFDALNKLFDEPTKTTTPVAPTVPTPETTTPAAAPAVTPVGTDDFQSKLDAFKPPLGAHPNVAAGMEQLKNLAKEAEARSQEYQGKIKTYEEQLKEFNELKTGVKLPKPIEEELTGLRNWRREMDYRLDPDFQKNFVQPVRQAEQDVMGLLKQAGMREEVEQFIQQNGGIIALSQSGENAGVKDNPDMTMAEWVEKQLLGPTPAVFKNRIIGKITQAQDAIERGRTDLQDFQANAKERWETKMQKMKADFESGANEAIAEIGDLGKPIVVSATATPEERVKAEAHNARLKTAADQYNTYLYANKDPKTAGKLLAKATQSDVVYHMYLESQAKVKALEERLTGIKASGSHSLAGDHAPAGTPDKPSMTDLLKKSTESAMNDLFKTQPGMP
jgi:hypothetical protein